MREAASPIPSRRSSASTAAVRTSTRSHVVYTRARGTPTRRPLVFVHGVYHGAWCFQEHFAPYFAGLGHPCYALTLRGHGGDAAAPCRLARADYAADVQGTLAAISPEALAIGHSLGGMLLQTLIAAGAIREAVLLSTPTPWALFRRALALTLRRPGLMVPAWLRLDVQGVYHREDVISDNFFSADLSPELRARYVASLRAVSYGGWAFLRTILASVPRRPRGRPVRVLVVGGRNDPTCTPDVQRTIARLYETKPVIVDGVSHDLMLETRWRDAAEIVGAWVNGGSR